MRQCLALNCDHRGPIESTRPSDRSLLPEYGLCGLDEDAQLRRQRCTPRIIKKQSIELNGALRQQPFEAALADVAARQRFGGIGAAYARRRKFERVRRIRHQRRSRRLHRRDRFAVHQLPVENPARAGQTHSDTIVPMEIADRFRHASRRRRLIYPGLPWIDDPDPLSAVDQLDRLARVSDRDALTVARLALSQDIGFPIIPPIKLPSCFRGTEKQAASQRPPRERVLLRSISMAWGRWPGAYFCAELGPLRIGNAGFVRRGVFSSGWKVPSSPHESESGNAEQS